MSVAQTIADNVLRANKELETAIMAMLETPGGRRIFAWLVEISGVYADAPEDDRARTAWIGHRALGLHIIQTFRRVSPDFCHLAETERRTADAAAAARVEEARSTEASELAKQPPIEKYTLKPKE